jgi:curved DNA-binding protein CbpA
MSAPLAGKFQDHYAILGIDPKADSETIQRAYSQLAQRLNPKTSPTGDAEKFEALNVAYEVLSDPGLRASFDQVKGVNQEEVIPKFSGAGFFHALGRESALRTAVLCVLYDRRQTKPMKPSISMRHLEGIVNATSDEVVSALWYLKQRGLAISNDQSSLQITVDGMDFVAQTNPSPQDVMPFIRGAADSPKAVQPESVLNVLNRALTRA